MKRLAYLMLLPAALLLGVLCQVGHASTLPTIGQSVAGEIMLLGKRIPLPDGAWRVASAGFGRVARETPGPYGAIGGVLLVRPGGPTREFLLIHTNALPLRDGWGPPSECQTGAPLFSSVGEMRNLHNACSFVVPTRIGWLARAELPALGDDAEARASLPPWALIAGFRVSDRRDVLDMRYGIVPPATLGAAGWFGGADKLNGPQLALVAELGAWAQRARVPAFAALRDPADQVPAFPSPLQRSGSDIPPVGEEISALRLALYKLATYRLPASTASLLIAWGLSGNFYTGVQTMIWQGLTHSAVFFGNEMLWEQPQTLPAMPFTGGRDTVTTGKPRSARAAAPGLLFAAKGDALPLPAATRSLPSVTTIPVDGKLVPLPGDGWMTLARDETDRITGTVFARLDGKVLTGLALAHTNQLAQTAIIGTSSECGRSDLYFALTRYDTPEDGYCLYGKQVIPSQAAADNRLWAKALDRLRADGIPLPSPLMMIGARARTRENLLDVRYYFIPPATLTNRDRDDTGLSADPVAALQTWADMMQEPLELGVRGRALPPNASLPWPWDAEAVNTAIIDQAHAPLMALAAAGALDPAALRQQLAQADEALAIRERQRWSLWSRTVYKVATYRAASYVDSAAVSWLITGSVGQGFAFASINAVARPIMAYVNEIAWAHSSIGKAPASLTPVDFADIGPDFH